VNFLFNISFLCCYLCEENEHLKAFIYFILKCKSFFIFHFNLRYIIIKLKWSKFENEQKKLTGRNSLKLVTTYKDDIYKIDDKTLIESRDMIKGPCRSNHEIWGRLQVWKIFNNQWQLGDTENYMSPYQIASSLSQYKYARVHLAHQSTVRSWRHPKFGHAKSPINYLQSEFFGSHNYTAPETRLTLKYKQTRG